MGLANHFGFGLRFHRVMFVESRPALYPGKNQ